MLGILVSLPFQLQNRYTHNLSINYTDHPLKGENIYSLETPMLGFQVTYQAICERIDKWVVLVLLKNTKLHLLIISSKQYR